MDTIIEFVHKQYLENFHTTSYDPTGVDVWLDNVWPEIPSCLILLMIVIMVGRARGETPRVLCGRKLAQARFLYCVSLAPDEGAPADPPLQKRSIPDASPTAEPAGQKEVATPLSKPVHKPEWSWDRVQALAAQSRGKRVTGLVDECCYKPCYLSELLNYC